MKFSIRDTQTDFSLHEVSSSELIHFLLDKKVIDELKINIAVSKIAGLAINKSIKIKHYAIIRTQ